MKKVWTSTTIGKKTGHKIKFQQELGFTLFPYCCFSWQFVTGLQMVPLGSIYSAGDSPMGKIPSIPWRERDYVRSYILPPTQAGTLVFTPSVWEPRFRSRLGRWSGSWLVGWLYMLVGWYICYTEDVWRFLEKKNSRIVLYIWKKPSGDFWVELCCWCYGTMYLGFQWSISILVNVASLLHLAMGSK